MSVKRKNPVYQKKPLKKSTALVTGAGGFIGSRLLKELAERNYRIRALFLPGENASEADALGADIIRGDITDPASLKGITWKADIVFHLATRVLDWGSKKIFRRVMVDGTRNLLEECSRSGSGRFVYFSSIAALGLGRHTGGLTEDAECVETGVHYGDTKKEAEDLVDAWCCTEGMPFTIIRPANVTGPGSVWVKDILDAFFRGPLPLIDGGRAPGAFVYVDNLVEGVILAAESPVAEGQTYHFRDDYDITWGQYISFLGTLVGKHPRGNLPFGLAWMLGRLLEAILTPVGVRPPMTRLAAGVMGRNNDVDVSRARNELGWTGRVDLETALGNIERWVREVYLPSRMSGH